MAVDHPWQRNQSESVENVGRLGRNVARWLDRLEAAVAHVYVHDPSPGGSDERGVAYEEIGRVAHGPVAKAMPR